MTAPLSAQSAIEILESEWHTGDSVQALIVLRRVVKDYSSMRAESERLREDFEYKNEQLGSALIRVEKAEAELAAADKELAVRTESQGVAMAEVERLREDCDRTADVVVEQMEELDKLKAELAKQAPLVEAVDKWDGRVAWASVKPLIQSIDDYRAALAPREEKK